MTVTLQRRQRSRRSAPAGFRWSSSQRTSPIWPYTLELLRPQCESLGAECIVVDASEHRLESIHQAHPWVTWINYSGPFWRSSTIPHQRNVGCRAATGDIIAFCDAGGEPDADWLRTITAPLLNGTRTLVCGPVYSKRVGVYSVINDAERRRACPVSPFGNLAFLKSVFNQVDGFDERLFYGSDVDFSWRCANSGHPCYQVRGARHEHGLRELLPVPASLLALRSRLYSNLGASSRAPHLDHEEFTRASDLPRVDLARPASHCSPPRIASCAGHPSRGWASSGFSWCGTAKLPVPSKIVAIMSWAGPAHSMRRLVAFRVMCLQSIFFPDDETPYLRRLSEALTSEGTPVSSWRAPTRSATINLLLGPLWVGVARLARREDSPYPLDLQILPIVRSATWPTRRWWFGVFLASAHAAGIKIVWTAHNLLPHEAVFDDDMAARRVLATEADAIIALSAP